MLRFLSTLLLGCLLSTHLLAGRQMDLDAHLVDAWRLRTDRAAQEVERLVDRHSASDSLHLAATSCS